MDILSLITDNDDKLAYENVKRIAAESAESDKYCRFIPDFASLLANKKSYVRTRALILCCSQARWDTAGQLRSYLPDMLRLLHDEKPTVVRQSLKALMEVVVFRPELSDAINAELDKMDLSKYKDSMTGLISADISGLRELIDGASPET